MNVADARGKQTELERKMAELDALLAQLNRAITNLEEEIKHDTTIGHEDKG